MDFGKKLYNNAQLLNPILSPFYYPFMVSRQLLANSHLCWVLFVKLFFLPLAYQESDALPLQSFHTLWPMQVYLFEGSHYLIQGFFHALFVPFSCPFRASPEFFPECFLDVFLYDQLPWQDTYSRMLSKVRTHRSGNLPLRNRLHYSLR